MSVVMRSSFVTFSLILAVSLLSGCQDKESTDASHEGAAGETSAPDSNDDGSKQETMNDSARYDGVLTWTIESDRGSKSTKKRLLAGGNGTSNTKLSDDEGTEELTVVFLRHDEGVDYYDVEMKYPDGSMSRTVAFAGEKEEQTVMELGDRKLTIRAWSAEIDDPQADANNEEDSSD